MLIAGIAAGVSALSSIIGTAVANKKTANAQSDLNDYYDDQISWYDDQISQNYLDRADSSAALKKIYDANQDNLQALNTNAVKSGLTDEAKVAAASSANKSYASAVSDINAQGAQYKDSLAQQRNSVKTAKAIGNYNNAMTSANNTGQMISNIGSAAGNLASIYGSSGSTPASTVSTPTASGITSLQTPITLADLTKGVRLTN